MPIMSELLLGLHTSFRTVYRSISKSPFATHWCGTVPTTKQDRNKALLGYLPLALGYRYCSVWRRQESTPPCTGSGVNGHHDKHAVLWHIHQNGLKTNIGSGNGLVPSGNKPLPEPMLTEMVDYVPITPLDNEINVTWRVAQLKSWPSGLLSRAPPRTVSSVIIKLSCLISPFLCWYYPKTVDDNGYIWYLDIAQGQYS